MIIQTTKEINGVIYAYAYSDSGFMIERDGVRYSEAIDPIGSNRVYTETDESIETEALSENREKVALVDKLYSGEITIDDVPTEWQEEIQRRVDERIAAEGAAEDQEISGDEFLSMIEEVL